MAMGLSMMIVGGIMFVLGLLMYYSIELGQTDQVLRLVKNTGTFVGLSGMGVTLAGILLYLINRNEAPIQESHDN
jgi:hypothetical protein